MINGAVSAIQDEFGSAAPRSASRSPRPCYGPHLGAVTAGRLADRIGRLSVDEDRRGAVPRSAAIGTGSRAQRCGWSWFSASSAASGSAWRPVIAPAYIAETSPPRIRGRLGLTATTGDRDGHFPVAGGRLSAGADWPAGRARSVWLGLEAWRWMFLVMAVPAVVYGVLAFTIPESPRYPRCEIPDSGSPPGARACCSARRTSSSRSPASRSR